MNNNIINPTIFAMIVIPLLAASAGIPDLDCIVLGGGDHPLTLTVEADTSDVALVTFKGEYGVRVCRFYVIELHIYPASCGQEALVGGDAETVYLGVGVLDGARADTRESFPEAGSIS
jgi:hypothetical protein